MQEREEQLIRDIEPIYPVQHSRFSVLSVVGRVRLSPILARPATPHIICVRSLYLKRGCACWAARFNPTLKS